MKANKNRKITWMLPEKKGDQEISPVLESFSWTDFNAPLSDNEGGACVLEATEKIVLPSSQNEANEDISAGRVKTFDNTDDLIASLKRPW